MALLSASVLVTAAAVVVVARRIIHPVRSRLTKVLHVPGEGRIVIEATPLTRQAGTLGLLYRDETRHAIIGPILSVSNQGGIQRSLTLTDGSPALRAGEFVRPVGNVFATAEDVSHEVREVILNTTQGSAPAWLFAGVDDKASTWAIHIHGSLSGREGAFRSVHSLAKSGYTSLVPSMRGDGEGPPAPRGAFTLGQTEWLDIEIAVDYAVALGAERVVLVGWSSGATIALHLAANSRHREIIQGLILISPVLNWRNSILLSARNGGVPKVIATAAIRALGVAKIAQLLGSAEPLRFNELDWTDGSKRVSVPTLLIHSAGDRTAPYGDTRELATSSDDYVELVTFDPTGHALEWNSDREYFDEVILNWCSRTQR